MAKRSCRVITMAPLDLEETNVFMVDREENDISCWEYVNNSDGEYSDDSLSVESLPDDIVSWNSSSSSSSLSSSPTPQSADEIGRDLMIAHLDVDVRDDSDHDDKHENAHQEVSRFSDLVYDNDPYGYYDYNYGRDDDGEVDDEDDDHDGCDLDDELVPRHLSGKVGRERMRKLGKRAFSKVTTSKRSPFSHVKPGCVYGKHGLGMKFR